MIKQNEKPDRKYEKESKGNLSFSDPSLFSLSGLILLQRSPIFCADTPPVFFQEFSSFTWPLKEVVLGLLLCSLYTLSVHDLTTSMSSRIILMTPKSISPALTSLWNSHTIYPSSPSGYPAGMSDLTYSTLNSHSHQYLNLLLQPISPVVVSPCTQGLILSFPPFPTNALLFQMANLYLFFKFQLGHQFLQEYVPNTKLCVSYSYMFL